MANFLSNLTICLGFAAFFSINFILVASAPEASNHTEPVIKNNPQLGELCSANATCHTANAVCRSGHCLCPLGFTVASDKNGTQSCHTYDCSNNTTTNATCALFGEAATCGPASTCQCLGPKNHVDEVAQECINFEAKCTSDHQCAENFRCNTKSKCECKFGFVLKDFACVQVKCHEDKECQSFGSHTSCSNQTQTCQCTAPFELDVTTEKCYLKLKSTCASDAECGLDAKCISGLCSCRMGYVPEGVNGFNCKLYPCANDDACRTTFSNSTMCRKKEKICECFPPTKFRLDERKQECVSLSEPPSCSTSKCLPNSECVSGSCQCKIGYYQTEQGECVHFPCDYYVDDCFEVFEHSSCSGEKSTNSTCVCKPLFKLNEFGTACESEKNLEFAYGVIGVGIIAFFGPIIFFTMRRMIC